MASLAGSRVAVMASVGSQVVVAALMSVASGGSGRSRGSVVGWWSKMFVKASIRSEMLTAVVINGSGGSSSSGGRKEMGQRDLVRDARRGRSSQRCS